MYCSFGDKSMRYVCHIAAQQYLILTFVFYLAKQPLDDLCYGVGFVDLLGLGVVGVELCKGAPHAAKVRHRGGVPLAVRANIGALITAAKWAACDIV